MVARRNRQASKKAWVARKRMAEARAVAEPSQAIDSVSVDDAVKVELTDGEGDKDALFSQR